MTCKAPGCDRRHSARGYCHTHYYRVLRGSPLDAPVQVRRSHLSLEQRLQSRSEDGPNGCRLWTGPMNGDGYGTMHFKGRSQGTHRWSYLAHIGPIDDGLHVCHRCDVRSCINPDHLFLGTNADNVRDRHTKGRTPRGEDCHNAQLTNRDAYAVRVASQAGYSQAQLGDFFGVRRDLIGAVARGYCWRHAGGPTAPRKAGYRVLPPLAFLPAVIDQARREAP